MIERLNAWFDGLPRTEVHRLAAPLPAFRTLGIAGYYVAVGVTMFTGLWAGRSLLILLAVSAACALSFFIYALLRKALTGREELVLLEHVWFAIACSSATLWALHEPQLLYLDPAAAGLCFFLAFGRAGCTVVGCCHGYPSSVGIVYPEQMKHEGFSHHLWGVRLFPTQTIEGVALVVLGLICSVLVVRGAPGDALFTFGAGYAVMRFGLEALRFDRRPHWLGLSQSRWMALVELAVVMVGVEWRQPVPFSLPHQIALGGLVALLVFALIAKARTSPARRLRQGEIAFVREQVRTLAQQPARVPVVALSPLGTSVAVSRVENGVHLSLSVAHSLWWGCQVLALALPEVEPEQIELSESGVVHVVLSQTLSETAPPPRIEGARAYYGAGLRRMRQLELLSALPVEPEQPEPRVEYFRKLR